MVLITSFVKLNKFPVSRCLFVMQEIRLRALARDAAMIAELAGRGAAKAQRALQLDSSQRSARTTLFPPEARELDHLVDYGLNGIGGYCNTQIRLFRGEERGAAAQRVKQVLLPEGVGFITSLPYADEQAQVQGLLERAASPELSADMAVLVELPVLLERLRVINEKYGAALLQAVSAPTRQDVRDERDRCQEILAEVVALIFGLYALQPPERQEDRDFLLEPILLQDEAIRARRRRRRQGGQDTEPVTDPLLPAPGDLTPAPGNDQDGPVEPVA
jgi:hypothetical protein